MENFTANGWNSILPAGWSDRSMITLIGGTGASGVAANIVVTREETNASPVSIEDYAEMQKQAMTAEIPHLQILDERPTTVNNAPAFQRLQRFEIENTVIQQAQTFILAKDAVYVITGTAAIEDFNGIIAAVREFTENFRLTNR